MSSSLSKSFAPVIYAAMGFIMGALSAFLYNPFAKWVGGIEVQVQAVDPARIMG
jgi:hypothetical protein